MRLQHLPISALLPTLTIAHFTLLHPSSVYTLITNPQVPATVPPCGYSTLTSSTIVNDILPNITTYLNLIALSTHGKATWNFRFFEAPLEFDIPQGEEVPGLPTLVDLYRTVETEGEGTFCILNAWVGEEVAEQWEDETGRYEKPGWLSVMGEMDEGTFYQCAYVVMQSEIPLLWPTICANDSSVSVRYKEDGGTDGGSDDGANTSSVTMPIDTGATAGPAAPTQTSTDIAPGVSGAPTDTTSATSSASTAVSDDTSTASTTSAPAVVVTGGTAETRSIPFGIAGLALFIGGAVVV